MNIESSNLSHREYLHLNGMLSQERTEQALDDLDNAISYDVREFAPYAQEARCGYASEDFAQEEVKDLREFAKRLRGGNKQDLLMYIEALESRIHELVLSAEYGNEQLNNIIKTIVK